MDTSIQTLSKLIESSTRIVGFTGAGISTESGISDYRSKGGIWERFQPVYFDEFIRDEKKRRLYWQRKLEIWPSIRDAEPNKGHLFFTRLHNVGKLLGIITQNIDGLHEKAGVPSEKIVRLHGNTREIVCLGCGQITPTAKLMEALSLNDLSLDNPPPTCAECGGLLKPNTISFGQNLDPASIHRAEEMAAECDLMLCFGSTLVVYPAAAIPAAAKRRGAALVIITLSETPLDSEADVVLNRSIGEVVQEVDQAVRW